MRRKVKLYPDHNDNLRVVADTKHTAAFSHVITATVLKPGDIILTADEAAKVRAGLYSKSDIDQRFKDCFENKWVLSPSHQYNFRSLVNQHDQIVFGLTRSFEAAEILDRAMKEET